MEALAALASVNLRYISEWANGKTIPARVKERIISTLTALQELRESWPAVPLDMRDVVAIKRLLLMRQRGNRRSA
jgi:hypothetical protein